MRFSKIVSVMTDVPSATVFNASNCACMSVGNPGYGAVLRWVERSGPSRRMRRWSWRASIVAPASASLSITDDSVVGSAPVSVTSPPVAVAAARKVPVSIRSGMIRCVAPCRLCAVLPRPSIRIWWVPAPLIFAPIALRHSARSTTSGSRAAFSSTVTPSASVAAIITFSVPVTVTMSNSIVVPRSRDAWAWM